MKGDEPAFVAQEKVGGGWTCGMTKRELIAMLMTLGLLTRDKATLQEPKTYAMCGLAMADALIAELSKEPPPTGGVR